MIDRERFSRMLEESARLMLEEADALSEIDSKFGDGDHGITVTKIAKAIQQQVAAWDKGQPLKDFLEDLGMDVMAVRGGSAGPLYGTLVGGLGVELADNETVVTGDAARRMFAGCLSELRDITTAQVGDKTMMDAVVPAVEAAQACASDDRPTCSPLRPTPPRRARRPPSSSPRSSAAHAATASRPSARRRGRRVHLALLPRPRERRTSLAYGNILPPLCGRSRFGPSCAPRATAANRPPTKEEPPCR